MLIIMPTYNRLEFVKASLDSVLQDIKNSYHNHKLVIIDNASVDGTRKYLGDLQIAYPYFDLHLNDDNEGKAVAVNKMVERYGNLYPIMCSFDSDLVCCSNGTFDILQEMTLELVCRERRFSCICANQKEDSAHIYRILSGRYKSKFGEMLYNRNTQGVAGGCLCTSVEHFKAVGGYRTSLGVFGGNDGFLIRDLKDTLGCNAALAKDLSVIHPFDKDQGYREYKINAVEKINETGFGTDKGYWD